MQSTHTKFKYDNTIILTTCTIILTLVLISLAVWCGCFYSKYWELSDERLSWLRLLLYLSPGVALAISTYFHRKHLLIKKQTFCIVTIIGILFIFLGNYEIYDFLPQIVICILLTIGFICLSYSLLGNIASFLWLPFIFLSSIMSGCYWMLGIECTPQVMSSIFAASKEEVSGFIMPEYIVSVLLLLAFCFMLVFVLKNVLKGEKRPALASFGLIFISMSLLAKSTLLPPICSKKCNKWPISSLQLFSKNAAEGVENNRKIVSLVTALPSPAKQPSHITTLKGNEGVICILHVGESVRADRLSLNGWKNDTTPWLRQQSRLINFPVCISTAPETMKSMVTILTNGRYNMQYANDKNYLPTVGCVADLFDANGFECASFWGRGAFEEGHSTTFTQLIYVFTEKCKRNFEHQGLPMEQVPQILHYIQESGNSNLFIIVNNQGSHMPFENYDTANPRFTPTDTRSFYKGPKNNAEEAEKASNAYDNTLYYTDMYISQLLEGLKGRPFVYMYVGDHGEYVGQDGNRWMRGGEETPEDYCATDACKVPLFIYASRELEALHPHFNEALRHLNDHRTMVTGQEHVFHTLLGFFGIETPYYDASLDLSSTDAKPYTGPQPQSKGKPLEEDWH